MKETILKTSNLTKRYHGVTVLSEVSVTLEAGRIYGLIGKNGAGKTTLMRLAAGLSYPDSGSVELFGCTGERAMQDKRKRMGCMIEYPSLIQNMSAADNLKYHRIMRGIPNQEAEGEQLELVGLLDAKKKKVKNFSLGMKQRLGICVALLGNPEFLILDEPVNGLDPSGMVEIRRLMKRLCEERGMTILVSSHNLPEIYQTATDYIVIHKGEIKKTLTLEEFEDCCKHYLLIACTEPEKLVRILETKLYTENYKVMPDKTIRLYDFLGEKERVARMLMEQGLVITNFSAEGETLEHYFLSVTEPSQRSQA